MDGEDRAGEQRSLLGALVIDRHADRDRALARIDHRVVGHRAGAVAEVGPGVTAPRLDLRFAEAGDPQALAELGGARLEGDRPGRARGVVALGRLVGLGRGGRVGRGVIGRRGVVGGGGVLGLLRLGLPGRHRVGGRGIDLLLLLRLTRGLSGLVGDGDGREHEREGGNGQQDGEA